MLFGIIMWLGAFFLLNTNTTSRASESRIIQQKKLIIPDESNLYELEKIYTTFSSHIENLEKSGEEIMALYATLQESEVCSEANSLFNQIDKIYISYTTSLLGAEECLSSYTDIYNDYSDAISEIPQYSSLYNEKHDALKNNEKPKKLKKLFEKQANLSDIYADSKKIADDYFESDYYLMCQIVNAEAGSNTCTAEDRYCVAKVIENRKKHPSYPNTLAGVIYAPGAYEPVSNGDIHKTPTEEVKRDVEYFLRGHVELNMPPNVVFQAKFPQGSGTWKYLSSSKHYFCYY